MRPRTMVGLQPALAILFAFALIAQAALVIPPERRAGNGRI